jgi:glycosyltransferase involved in cell wall biosynthesis
MSKFSQKIIYIIGAFPPPTHGMALINEKISSLFSGCMPIKKFDTSQSNLSRGFVSRFHRFFSILLVFTKFIFSPNKFKNIFYIGLSGGYGQFYDLIFILLARLFFMKIIVHHHSFNYINNYKLITKLLCYFCGFKSIFIFLSPKMMISFNKLYNTKNRSIYISNAFFIGNGLAVNPSNDFSYPKIKKIGFLSNLSEEKGAMIFLDVAAEVLKVKPDLKFIIAGPCTDKSFRDKFFARASALSNVCYLGPVFNGDKINFFKSIDLLLFPTLYKNEAEPLILYEAMRFSVPVIAYGRGCISEILSEDSGISVPITDNFITTACMNIYILMESPGKYQLLRANAYRRFSQNYLESKAYFNNFLNIL